jgi:hypothetical protein
MPSQQQRLYKAKTKKKQRKNKSSNIAYMQQPLKKKTCIYSTFPSSESLCREKKKGVNKQSSSQTLSAPTFFYSAESEKKFFFSSFLQTNG